MELKKQSMDDYLLLMRTFEYKKCAFGDDDYIRLSVPYALTECHQTCNNGEDLGTSIRQHPLSKSMRMKRDKLDIDRDVVLKFHEDAVTHIVDKISEVLMRVEQHVPFIYCVGGFAASSVVKQRLKQAFTKKQTNVVFPENAVSAIMRGAVILARDDTVVEKRISRFTIGLDWNVKFDPSKHRLSKREVTDSGVLCSDIFRIIVRAGDTLETGKPVHEVTAYVKTEQQEEILFPFYRSEITRNPEYIDEVGCYLMGSMSVPMKDTTHGLERWAKLKVYMDQLLHAEADDKDGNKHKVKLLLQETVV